MNVGSLKSFKYIYPEMGFQCLRLDQQKMEPISNAKCDKNKDWLTVVKSSDTTNLQLTNLKDDTLDTNYIAWTVSACSFFFFL